jgi:6-phosphogluconate dehydrogenase
MIKATIGLIGLGRMGLGIAKRLLSAGYIVMGFDPSDIAMNEFKSLGGVPSSYNEIATESNFIWLMIPEQYVDDAINKLKDNLKKGAVVVDGGNSYYKNSIRRAQELSELGIDYLDCGTSGGIHGQDIGYCLMIGGDKAVFLHNEEIFKIIATENGYQHISGPGSGHYVKMVHNGIEYSLLQSYAEGFALLKDGEFRDLNLEKIADLWNHGSIIRSWIVELSKNVFVKDQDLKDISGKIGGGQTGSWALSVADDANAKMRMLEKALEIRNESQSTGGDYSTKLVAMLRNQFGGHSFEKS